MARVKLYESDAKRLLFPDQLIFSATTKTTSSELKKTFGTQKLVVKVDQGIKKRGKQGLVAVNVDAVHVVSHIRQWSDRGFRRFIVEQVVAHDSTEERYLSLERKRDGWQLLVGNQGGIDIEEHWDQVHAADPSVFRDLIAKLDHLHIATLEVNPYVMRGSKMIALDAAAEIDSAALNTAEMAQYQLEPVVSQGQSDSEKKVEILDASTPASLKYRLINPQASLWMLLSGGGASLVLADEVADLGYGKELANYGEYSGAPTDDDTYAYAKIILSDMMKAKGKKALIIAGGVANFTDVAKTFRGLIRAMSELSAKLTKANVRVFVRRGGPNEQRGLAMMESFLKKSDVYGSVYGHEIALTQVVTDAIEYLKEGKE